MDANAVWAQFQEQAILYGPMLLGAAAALIIGWLAAMGARMGVTTFVDRLSFAKKANESAAQGRPTVGRSIGDAVYWVIILVALTVALGALGMTAVLQPLNAMLSEFLGFLPNLVGGALLFFLGFMLAIVAQRAITGVLTAARLDTWAERAGIAEITGAKGLSNAVGVLVFTLIMIVISIPALDALQLTAVSQPATDMLRTILAAIPNIFAAVVVLLIAYLIARAVAALLRAVLPQVGFDKTAGALGLTGPGAEAGVTPTSLAASLAFIAILIFGAIEAMRLLNFEIVSELLTQILTIGASIVFGAVIIAFGVIFAGVVKRAIASTGDGARKLLADIAQWGIIALAITIGLRQMGLANEIIIVGFSLIVGAAAVAAAIAFGIGGRDWAKRQLERLSSQAEARTRE